MDLVLCHTTADFDTLGAAVGLTCLMPGAMVVLTGATQPTVKEFLALHRDEYARMVNVSFVERIRHADPHRIRRLWVVDAQQRDRLGQAAAWLDLPGVEVTVFDHHPGDRSDIPANQTYIEPVGATTTLVVEELQKQAVTVNPMAATAMALGIHVDTGSLTYESSTPRDARALAWLMERGASAWAIAEYVKPRLSETLQELLARALQNARRETVRGQTVAWMRFETARFIPGLSGLTEHLMELTESDAVLLGHQYHAKEEPRLAVIGRSRIESVDLNALFQPLGGGGHRQAAAAVLKGEDASEQFDRLVAAVKARVEPPPTARELMSSPVRTVRPDTTIAEAQRVLLRYGHSGLCVVDRGDRLVGIISRRDIDLAMHHGFAHAPVKGYMSTRLNTITPNTPLPEIQSLMVTFDVGRLPVLEEEEMVGIVTRTDVLRQLHATAELAGSEDGEQAEGDRAPREGSICVLRSLRDRLAPHLWQLLAFAASESHARGWHLYLVGGAVRDLFLAEAGENEGTLQLTDIDLVVEGFHRSVEIGAGGELARALQQHYPEARLDIHGQFQTAALLWHKHPLFDSLWVDIATARTEFYPYPAANPEVEASSIRQDLYRRDFTINALAWRLTAPREGELLDFFNGRLDLQKRQVRVLHANSFIEDPTRIYRAVRFAVRLGFTIEPQTEGYIRYAIQSGVYDRTQRENPRVPALQTRLKAELKYILAAPYWQPALKLLDDLGALACLHPSLSLDRALWQHLRLAERWWRRVYEVLNNATTPPLWELLLETLLASLGASQRLHVARALQLSADTSDRLARLDDARWEITRTLPQSDRPSQIVQHLRPYDTQTLMLVAMASDRPVRRAIWRYLTQWSQVKPILSGNDLKALGYKPGPQFRAMLDRLLAATLDGDIALGEIAPSEASPEAQRQAAIAFVRQTYPV